MMSCRNKPHTATGDALLPRAHTTLGIVVVVVVPIPAISATVASPTVNPTVLWAAQGVGKGVESSVYVLRNIATHGVAAVAVDAAVAAVVGGCL